MSNEMNKQPEAPEHEPPTTITHYGDEQDADTHAVVVDALRVVLVQDDECWFAQGLELDYAASGHNLDDVKQRFEQGLTATFNEHLRIYGTVENFLKVAPQEAWDLWLNADKRYAFTCASVHNLADADALESNEPRLPFSGIAYLVQPVAA